jgi:hypothetical protein
MPSDPDAYPKLEHRIHLSAHTFEAIHVSNCMWAFATKGLVMQRSTLQALEARIHQIIATFNPQNVSNVAWAYAKMELRPANNLLGTFESRVKAIVHLFNAQNIGNVMWAFAKMGYMLGQDTLHLVSERVPEIIHDFNEQNLTNTMWSFGMTQVMPPFRLKQALEGSILANGRRLPPQDSVNLLWSYARLGIMPPEPVMQTFNRSYMEKIDTFDSQHVANCLWAHAALGIVPERHLQEVLERRASEVSLNAQETSNVFWSLATLSILPNEALREALEARVLATSSTLESQHISNILWAYAKFGVMPSGQTIDWLETRFCETAASFTAQGLANVVWACAKLDYKPSDAMLCVLEDCLRQIMGSFNPQHTSNIIWGYATWQRMPEAVLKSGLEAQARAVLGEMLPQHVSNVMWALATLEWQFSDGGYLLTSLQERAGQIMPEMMIDDVCQVFWALGSTSNLMDGAFEYDQHMFELLENRMVKLTSNPQFVAKDITMVLNAYGKLRRLPLPHALEALQSRFLEVAGLSSPQDVCAFWWTFVVFGRLPREQVVAVLEERTALLAQAFDSRHLAVILWSISFLDQLSPGLFLRVAHHLSAGLPTLFALSREREAMSTALRQQADNAMRQMHQVFVAMDLHPGWREQVPQSIIDLESTLRADAQEAFRQSVVSISAQQAIVSADLKAMGFSVEDEFVCPRSMYSIDMLVTQRTADGSTSNQTWAVEFDGPYHYLSAHGTAGADYSRDHPFHVTTEEPQGHTMLKHLHLKILGYNLVVIPYWDWNRVKDLPDQRRAYLRDVLR